MQRKWISAVLWENPIKHASTIDPDVFNSFYRTVTRGESHRIIYKEILLSMVTPLFRIWTSQQKSPKQVIFSVSTLLGHCNSKSPQARFSDHHKQNFSLLFPTSNNKVIYFLPLVSLNANRTIISITNSSTSQTGQTLACESCESWLVTETLPFCTPGFSRNNFHVCQNVIFLVSLIDNVGFCLANVFFLKNVWLTLSTCCYGLTSL